DNVALHRGFWSELQMVRFYLANHVFISPARGDAKGQCALEAGSTGCALVLSDVGGHQEWAMDEFAVMLEMEEEQVGLETVPRVRVGDGAAALEELARDREKARYMGTQASNIIPKTMSWERSVRDLLAGG